MFPAEAQQSHAPWFCFSSLTANKCLFHGILSHIFYVFVLCVGGFTVWNCPKHHSEVLSSVSKHRQVLMCLKGKIHILDKLHVGMSYRPVSRSSMLINKKYILNNVSLNRHILMNWLVKENVVIRMTGPNSTSPMRNGLVLADWMFSKTRWNVTITNDKNLLYIQLFPHMSMVESFFQVTLENL